MLWVLWMLGDAAAAGLPAADERTLAYYGDFIAHPGLDGRLGWSLSEGTRWSLQAEARAGGFWHPHNQLALYARVGPSIRRTGAHGGSLGAFLHAGVQHGFSAAPTYTVEDGVVKTVPLAGDTWATLTPGLELGRPLEHAALEGWFLRPQVTLRMPSFYTVGIDVALEVGVRFADQGRRG
ncbi:MAG: hypothetical protein ACI8S6_005668 [Myxococcota bacterium]|jgi:hypothetical protein